MTAASRVATSSRPAGRVMNAPGERIALGFANAKLLASSKSRTAGGSSTGARSSTSSSLYSACSRAAEPPVKKDCSVCAASWTTVSPSIRPGQPRSSS